MREHLLSKAQNCLLKITCHQGNFLIKRLLTLCQLQQLTHASSQTYGEINA